MIPLHVEINVALKKHICQKIGSERVKQEFANFNNISHTVLSVITKMALFQGPEVIFGHCGVFIPPANKVWGYIEITLSVCPSVHIVSGP